MNAPLTINAMADLLGVSRTTIHRMRKAGELPPVIPTNRRFVRWSASDVALWFQLDCPGELAFKALKRTKQKFAKQK